jgi:hypothetical protein
MARHDSSSPQKSRLKGILKTGLWIFFLLMLVMAGYAFMAFRDRHPGYSVDLQISSPDISVASEKPLTPLRVGFGRMLINPDLSKPDDPVYIAGFSQNRKATAIHDDLWALASVLESGPTRLGIVALDAIGFFHDDVIKVRQQLATEWGLDYLVICSTHNHNTPDLMGLWGPHYLKSGVNQAYRDQVIQASVIAVSNAVINLQPSRIAFHEISTPTDGLVGDSQSPGNCLVKKHGNHRRLSGLPAGHPGAGNHPE